MGPGAQQTRLPEPALGRWPAAVAAKGASLDVAAGQRPALVWPLARFLRYNEGVQQGRSGARILALDLGARRMGLAVSDPLGLTAQGLATLERRNRRHDLAALQRLTEQYRVGLVLVGHPLHLSGRAGRQAELAQAFAEHLRRHLGVEVQMWDERLTTAQAQRVLRSGGMSLEKRRRAVDRMAAVLLLQSYLDGLP